ncbi:hypothetical protein [Kordia sp.]
MKTTNKLTRITAILIQLQSKRIVTAKEIAERFGSQLPIVNFEKN